MRWGTAWLAAGGSVALHAALVLALSRAPSTPRLERPAVTTVKLTATFRENKIDDPNVRPAPAAGSAEPTTQRRPKRVRGAERGRGPEVPSTPDAKDLAEEERRNVSRALPGGGVTDERIAKIDELPKVAILPSAPSNELRSIPESGGGGSDENHALAEKLGVDEIRPSGGGSYVIEHGAARAWIAHDGTLTVERPGALSQTLAIAHGLIFLDPMPLMNAVSGDSPAATDQLSILEKTRELRAQLCERATEESLKASLLELRAQLEHIWKKRSAAEGRREQIFGIWDGCLEEGSPAIVRTAETARAIAIDFIQTRLPAGSTDAYGEEELQRLNARRRSRQRFEPYALNDVSP